LVPFISQIAAWPLVFCHRMSGEVAGSNRFPTWPRVGAQHVGTDHVCPIHFPDRGLTIGVLPKNVGKPVPVEVTSSDHLPIGPGIAAYQLSAAGNPVRAIQFPNRGLTIGVLPKNVEWPSSLKSPEPMTFQLGPGLPPTN
jgi:hypothetical protein